MPPQIAVNNGGTVSGIDCIADSHSRLLPFVVMYLEISVTCQIRQPKRAVMKVMFKSMVQRASYNLHFALNHVKETGTSG
jgi:hypothetical protein